LLHVLDKEGERTCVRLFITDPSPYRSRWLFLRVYSWGVFSIT